MEEYTEGCVGMSIGMAVGWCIFAVVCVVPITVLRFIQLKRERRIK